MNVIPQPISMKQNILWNSIGCLIYQACQWIMTVAVVILSSNFENSGALAFAMSIGNIYFPLATYNMRTVQVSDVDGEFDQREYVAFRLITVVLSLIPILIYTLFVSSSPALVLTTICWLFFKADESFCSVYYGVDQLNKRMDYIGISQALRGLSMLAVFCLILYLGGSLNFAVIMGSVCCATITLFYDRCKASQFCDLVPTIRFARVVSLFQRYLPAVLTLVFYGSVVAVARQRYESIYGTEALGIYAAVATPTVLVQVAASYLYSPFLGDIAKVWKSKQIAPFFKFILFIIGSILVVGVIGILFASMAGKEVLQLVFGSTIADHSYLLVPAIEVAVITTLFAFMFDLLIVMRMLYASFFANLASIVCVSVCSDSLIIAFGGNGVSYAVLLSFGLGLIVCLVFFASCIIRNRKKL